MPELAEVEVVRRNLERWWEGRGASQVLVLDEKLLVDTTAPAMEEALLRPLEKADRRGKYLLCRLEGGQVVVFHFRMTGKIVCGDEAEPKYGRLSWFVDGSGWLVFKDQRRLGKARLLSAEEFEKYEPLQRMGPEPDDLSVDHLRQNCSDRRLLKTALLDQSVVAGVGNIAISEVFWRLELAPDVKCGQLSDEDWENLVRELPIYFEEIIKLSTSDEIKYVEEAGSSNIFQIYGRSGEECSRCGGRIEKMKVGGRTSYFCGGCQR